MFYGSISIRKITLILIRLNELILKVILCMTTSFDYLCKRQSKGPEPVQDLLG